MAHNKHTPLTADEKQARRADLMNKLEEGIASIQSGDAFRQYLDFAARFHNYSFNNTLLIKMQRPDASMVAGFHRWRQMGRYVRKGEKGIAIFAPHTFKRTTENDDDAFGLGFHVEYVFDVSQTDGDDLPSLSDFEVPEGECSLSLQDVLMSYARSLGLTVTFDPKYQQGNEWGWYSASEQMIYIRQRHTSGMVKTLIHELAHHLDQTRHGDRAEAEAVAEATAYVIASAHGIDCGDYSFTYVASWAGRKDGVDLLRSVLHRVNQNTRALFQLLDSHLEPVEQLA